MYARAQWHVDHRSLPDRHVNRPDAAEVASTVVHFADLTDEEIDAYVATGEPLRVAGAFTIDGLGGQYVDSVEGDPHNVVGLSLPLVRRLLSEFDLRVTSFGR